MIRFLTIVFIGFSFSPTAAAACWKLKDGSFVSASKQPSGSKRTLARYCSSSKPVPNSTPAPTSTPVPNSTIAPLRAWIGSPVSKGVWAPVDSTQLPGKHHVPYSGDWSVDIDADEGQTVAVFAAADFKGHKLTASVSEIADACTKNPSEGGKRVSVRFKLEGQNVGTVHYSHLVPASGLTPGDPVSVWGGELGTVFDGDIRGKCWDGTHVHVEVSSRPEASCWSKEWKQGSRVGIHDFIGFIGFTGMRSKPSSCP